MTKSKGRGAPAQLQSNSFSCFCLKQQLLRTAIGGCDWLRREHHFSAIFGRMNVFLICNIKKRKEFWISDKPQFWNPTYDNWKPNMAFVECKQIIITLRCSREFSTHIKLGSLLEWCSNKSSLMISRSSQMKYYFIANDLRGFIHYRIRNFPKLVAIKMIKLNCCRDQTWQNFDKTSKLMSPLNYGNLKFVVSLLSFGLVRWVNRFALSLF